MNINCQNSAYAGRLNLSKDEQIHKLLQGEIDNLTSNLDITDGNLEQLKNRYEITSNYIDSNLTPLTYLINTEITPMSILPPQPEIINTYIYNPNDFGEIRFWVKSTSNFPVVVPVGVPDYRVKIDVDGKLKLYYTYDPSINLTWGNGWIDPANMIVGAVADSFNQGFTIGTLQAEVLYLFDYIDGKTGVLLDGFKNYISPNDFSSLNESFNEVRNTLDIIDGRTGLSGIYENAKLFLTTGRTVFLNDAISGVQNYIATNPLTSFVLGAGGGALAIGYGIVQNGVYNYYLNLNMSQAISENSNLSINDKEELTNYVMHDLMSSNILSNLELNYFLQKEQGFVNCNILSNQYIASLNTSNLFIDNLNISNVIDNKIIITSNYINSNLNYNILTTSNNLINYDNNNSNILNTKINTTSNNLINYTNDNSNILNTKINTTSNNLINYTNYQSNINYTYTNDKTLTTSNNLISYNNYNSNINYLYTSNLNITVQNNNENHTNIENMIIDEIISKEYCKKTTFFITTNTLLNYGGDIYYTYTINLTNYIRYLQTSALSKMARFQVMSSPFFAVASYEYLTECNYTIMMSQSSAGGTGGGFKCRAFGTPADYNLNTYAYDKFIKNNDIYQITYLGRVSGGKILITIIDLL